MRALMPQGDGGDSLRAAGAAESPSLAQLSAVLVEHDGLGRSKVHALGQASVGIGKYVDPSGEAYTGEFKDPLLRGKRHGFGKQARPLTRTAPFQHAA